jgi:hypothetical protein
MDLAGDPAAIGRRDMRTVTAWLKYALVLAIAPLLMAPSCVPHRIHWSPDGQRAIVLLEGGAYLCDAQGKLSKPLSAGIVQVAWLADSKRLLGIQQVQLQTWKDVRGYLSEERQQRLLSLVEPARKEILAHEGSFKGWRAPSAAALSNSELPALWLCVCESSRDALREKLGSEWEELSKLAVVGRILRLYEAGPDGISASEEIFRTIDEVADGSLKVSPDATRFAFVDNDVERGDLPAQPPGSGQASRSDDRVGTLRAGLIKPNAELCKVAGLAGWHPDWSADGKSLVYATTRQLAAGNDGLVLGTIARVELAEQDGRLVLAGAATDLAGILYFPDTKVVCLRDGRIVFAALPVQLPATTQQMPKAPSLFAIQPEQSAVVMPLMTSDPQVQSIAEGFSQGMQELSPNGKCVTLVGGKNGSVGVYTFATGAMDVVLDLDESPKLSEVPSWRTDGELSLVVPAGHQWGSEKRCELVLYSIETKQARCISRDWPDGLMEKLASEKAVASQPASASQSQPQ